MTPTILHRANLPLEGEDLETTHWEDARHWMSVYADLLQFKVGMLARVQQELPKLKPAAQKAAIEDLVIIEHQMLGYQARLDLWYARVWDLQGLWLDPQGRMIRHQGREASLTKREFQLLQFLLDHPHRFFTANQILGQAWADPALFPEEVRNYVRRLRKLLAVLEIPADLVNKPGRGYSLVFRPDPPKNESGRSRGKENGNMAEGGRRRRPKPEDARGGQRPGEEPVQVNDAYSGGGPPPEQPTDDKQHPTGG